MRITIEDAEALDKLLRFTIAEAKDKHPNQWHLIFYDIQIYANKALRIEVADSKTRHYAQLLEDSEIVAVDSLQGFRLDEGTIQFMEDGGFIKLYNEAHYNQIQQQSDLELDRQVKNLTIRLGEVELRQKKERIFWLTIAAIVSAAVAMLFNSIF